MKFSLKTFKTELTVERIANIHYFEFVEKYHTVDDSHSFCELLYVDNGSIMVKSENYTGLVSHNQLIIHRSDETHSLMCKEDVAPNVIIIGFECKCDKLEYFSRKPVTLSGEHKKMLVEIMQEGINTYEPPYDTITLDMKKRKNPIYGSDQMLKLKMESFLITLIRDFGVADESLKKVSDEASKVQGVCQYINEHFTEKILLDNLCFLFGTNKTTLCRNFKDTFGLSINEYINSLKAKEAKRMFREGELSITQISEKLGFNSVHYFCRFFKKATGKSTTQYTKSIRSRLDI